MTLRLFFLIALATIILSAYNLDNLAQPAMAQYSDEPAEEGNLPTTTDTGWGPYVIEPDCASVEVAEGYYLYYSPTEPNYFCVQPDTQSPRPIVGGGAQVHSTCALGPDQRFYCSAQGELTAATLQELYAQGLLPSL